MRPVRLELEGFTAFRDRTVVDFDGVDLFALTGPTGAGKSSVIDAMIFALYGVVPRFDDARLVGAVVSQGRNEGRVRLDFAVGGEPWTAVRVVRLRDGKATTKEARLERDGEVVAGTAKELDAAVAELLGLSAGQFTTCVVLPQGQFARFLQAKPAERQDLLVRLLELGLYDAIREAAGQRAGKLEGELAAVRAHLARAGRSHSGGTGRGEGTPGEVRGRAGSGGGVPARAGGRGHAAPGARGLARGARPQGASTGRRAGSGRCRRAGRSGRRRPPLAGRGRAGRAGGRRCPRRRPGGPSGGGGARTARGVAARVRRTACRPRPAGGGRRRVDRGPGRRGRGGSGGSRRGVRGPSRGSSVRPGGGREPCRRPASAPGARGAVPGVRAGGPHGAAPW